MQQMRFQNRTVIVTGGSSGIGLACARGFASEGAKVLNADIQQPSQEAAKGFGNLPGEWRWIEADLADPGVPCQVADHALALWGKVDVLVNNAAHMIDQYGALLESSLEQWNRQFDISLKGTYLMTKCCLPEMIKRGGGAIVNVSSVGGIIPFGQRVAYCTVKAAILQFTRSVAIDYGLQGIRCNAVCPGAIDTPAFSATKDDPYELADREARIALGRIGKPDEVVAAIKFLASDEASYITGATLVVDGGWAASSWSARLGPRGMPYPASGPGLPDS
jgi:NAD(P)-dependent dehydrogenase (short-subunit alcohol dehydrogenase family)